MRGGDRIENEVETAGVFVHLFGVAREDDLMRAEADCVVLLGGRSREHHDVRSEGAGEFNPHVPKTAETDDADFLAWADFPMAHWGIGRDAGAEQRGDSGEWKIFRHTEDEVLVHDDAFRIAAVSGQAEVFVSPAIRPNLGGRKLLVARATVRAGQVGIHETANADQITGFEFGDGRPDVGDTANDFMARHAWVNGLHQAAPLVAGVMQVGVADAAEEDFNLHVARRRLASWNRGGGQW